MVARPLVKGDDNDRLRRGEQLRDPEDGAGTPVGDSSWPAPPAPAAYHGVAGRIVHALDPHTEADRVAVLVQLLAAFGNSVGRGPHYHVDGADHYAALFVVVVGQSGKGRKGTSWNHVRNLFRLADEDWTKNRIKSGLSSGEGLIHEVRDPYYKDEPIRENRQIVRYEKVLQDQGVTDKRLLVLEPELARVLQVATRDGNTLSATIRQAWDTGDLHVLTKNSPTSATDAYISIIGHITDTELLRTLSRTESANGFANRFLWVCARRSKELPEGGGFAGVDVSAFVRDLKGAIRFARQLGNSIVEKDVDARALWAKVYGPLTRGRPGLSGAILGRMEAQTMRLALVYALLDQCGQIKEVHLRAALALIEYVERSVLHVFGDTTGDDLTDDVLEELRAAAPRGLTRTDLRNRFQRNRSSEELSRALQTLRQLGLARQETARRARGEPGRPPEVWIATAAGEYAKDAEDALKTPNHGDSVVNGAIARPEIG
jgi:hypothetical protein